MPLSFTQPILQCGFMLALYTSRQQRTCSIRLLTPPALQSMPANLLGVLAYPATP